MNTVRFFFVGDPRRPYPLDIEMRSGWLGQMQERMLSATIDQVQEDFSVTGVPTLALDQENVIDNSSSNVLNGHTLPSGTTKL